MPDVVILCEPGTRAELGTLGPHELQIDLPLSREEGWHRDRHGCRQLVVECEGWGSPREFLEFLTLWWPGPEQTDPRPPLVLLHRDFGSVPNLQEVLQGVQEGWGNAVTATAAPEQWRSVAPGADALPPADPRPAAGPVPGTFAPAAPAPGVPPTLPPPPPVPEPAYGRPPAPLPMPAVPPPGGWPGETASASAVRHDGRRIVLLWGQEGGVGTTQIARALAHRLADEGAGAGWRAVLVDLHCNDGLEMLAAGNPTPHIGQVLYEPDPASLQSAIQADGRRRDVGFIAPFENPPATLIMETRREEDQLQWIKARLEVFERTLAGHIVVDAPAHMTKSLVPWIDAVVLVSSASRVAAVKLLKNLVWLRHVGLDGALHWIVNHGTARQPMPGGLPEMQRLLREHLGGTVPRHPLELGHCPEFMAHGSDSDYPWNYSRPLGELADRLAGAVLAGPLRSPLHRH